MHQEMKPVTVINRIHVRSGKMDEFLEAQRKFAAKLPSTMLVGGRMYRSLDGTSAVLISTFHSKSAQEEVFQRPDFKAHLERLQPLVESSSPMLYEEAYTAGDFR
jgi:quinol monooxygenase YgiN